MNWQETILRQYSGSEKMMSIIDTFDQATSIDDFTDLFLTQVWDFNTCGTFGLDIWGKIVNVSRYINADGDNEVFGFFEANSSELDEYPMTFNTAPFYAGEMSTNVVRLGDAAYRTLILCKAFSNISLATIPEINKFLRILFSERGNAYIINNRDMTITIAVDFKLEDYEAKILQNYDVMPIPSGVSVDLKVVEYNLFGFGDGFYPFDDGIFDK